MDQLPVSRVLAKALELADKYPRGLYEYAGLASGACSYSLGRVFLAGTSLKTTGCLVGQAIRELGEIVPEDHDTDAIDRLVNEGLILVDSQDDYEALSVLQAAQDRGETWGKAATLARDWLVGVTA